MTNKSPQEVKLVLTDNEGVGRISVDLEAFFGFSFWMAEELQDLVEKWKHLTPARTRRVGRTAGRRDSRSAAFWATRLAAGRVSPGAILRHRAFRSRQQAVIAAAR